MTWHARAHRHCPDGVVSLTSTAEVWETAHLGLILGEAILEVPGNVHPHFDDALNVAIEGVPDDVDSPLFTVHLDGRALMALVVTLRFLTKHTAPGGSIILVEEDGALRPERLAAAHTALAEWLRSYSATCMDAIDRGFPS